MCCDSKSAPKSSPHLRGSTPTNRKKFEVSGGIVLEIRSSQTDRQTDSLFCDEMIPLANFQANSGDKTRCLKQDLGTSRAALVPIKTGIFKPKLLFS